MSNDYYKQVFSENLKKYMASSGISSVELSRKLSVSKSTVSDWVHGNKLPRMGKIVEIARILCINKEQLLEREDHNNNIEIKPLSPQLSEDALHVAHQYEQLDEGDQGYIRGQLDLLLRADKYRKKEDSVS